MAHPGFYAYGIAAAIMTFYLSVSFVIGLFGRDYKYVKPKEIEPKNQRSVDVFLPICGEPIEVIENTWKHVRALDWVNLNVYVLDDGCSVEAKHLAEDYGFNYYVRPNRGVNKKAGNMRYAFQLTHGDFILVLDADFCPRPDFLKETIPSFLEDHTVAIVQTPQFFRVLPDQTWVEKGAGYIQELFYRLIQVNRQKFGGAICVGTNAVYRREALEPFGGTALIDYSEDVHTGFNIMTDGWNIKYMPLCLAAGICPDNLPGFFIQQYRWAMGSITLFLNKEFWKSRLTVMQKICYLSGMLYYITTGLGIFLTPLPAMLVLSMKPQSIMWYNCLFSVPSFIYGTLMIGAWSKAPFGMYAIRARAVAYYAHLFALWDKLFGTMAPWVPSGAVKKVKRFVSYKTLTFYWNSIISAITLSLIAYRANGEIVWYHLLPTLFFCVYNYWVAMSVLKDID